MHRRHLSIRTICAGFLALAALPASGCGFAVGHFHGPFRGTGQGGMGTAYRQGPTGPVATGGAVAASDRVAIGIGTMIGAARTEVTYEGVTASETGTHTHVYTDFIMHFSPAVILAIDAGADVQSYDSLSTDLGLRAEDTFVAGVVSLKAIYTRSRSLSLWAGGGYRLGSIGAIHVNGWRGRVAPTRLGFPAGFAGEEGPADVLPLSTSWRNDSLILDAANAVAAPLATAHVQTLQPRPGAGRGGSGRRRWSWSNSCWPSTAAISAAPSGS